jgi:diketogulonate reductase-like aldo/keto reductase
MHSNWLFVTNPNPVWQSFNVHIITGNAENNLYTNLQEHRSMRSSTNTDVMYTLRNGLPMPAVGLGTGGITWQRTTEVITEALRLGYRLLDSAREYGNERNIGDIFRGRDEDGVPGAGREDVFVVSKVWPTFLGFVPTTREIDKSLQALQSAYVDLYLLHWPT